MSQPLLFEEFSDLDGVIPWISLVNTPTPVKNLEKLENHLKTGTSIWIKQDNLTSATYGGNKVRKLEFLIADALEKEKETIATLGGIGTNHGLATAIFAKEKGLNVVLYLINQPLSKHVLDNLKLDFYYGAELKYVKNYLGVGLNFYFLDRLKRKRVYWLPAGGSTPIGILGYVNAVLELKQQIEEGKLPEPEQIYVAAGTTGTMAGIELGVQLTNLQTQVIGIRVTDKMAATGRKVKSLIKGALKILQKDSKLRKFQYKPKFKLIDHFFGGKYGRVTPEGLEAVEIVKKTEGVMLETTYTGKTLAALLAYVEEAKTNAPILFWNTYNSVDLSSVADQVNYQQLPSEFYHLFEDKVE
ncbi:MAG: pyridoxal-phosphate dependent enzyme [Candidatus Heimdallarchaeota archaeon]|nr:MAG: pyridoxal-phosphate dependent enzyme [Candidatus Heimdallarchaeota archaeon]